jgi:hypothetical protein
MLRSLSVLCLSLCAVVAFSGMVAMAGESETVRVGIIGCDTSHVAAFTGVLNDPKAEGVLAEFQVVAAYPGGSPDIESSHSRVDKFVSTLKEKYGVEICDSVPALLKKVDVILLESVDGRPHLEQAKPVIAAGKTLFIDKPMAGTLADAVEIFERANKAGVPCFSSSSLRFSSGFQAARQGEPFGKIQKCTAWSPMSIEPHHPDLFWYGIHGTEILFTIMGTGCETVTRVAENEVAGEWKGGRKGTFIGQKGYGANVEGTKSSGEAGKYEGYKPLVLEICNFFKTGKPPVAQEETLEIYTFMEAADESKRQGGKPVAMKDVLDKARADVAARMK